MCNSNVSHLFLLRNIYKPEFSSWRPLVSKQETVYTQSLLELSLSQNGNAFLKKNKYNQLSNQMWNFVETSQWR